MTFTDEIQSLINVGYSKKDVLERFKAVLNFEFSNQDNFLYDFDKRLEK